MADDVEVRVSRVEEKLDALAASVDARFGQVDARFDAVDQAFVEQRQYTEFAFDTLRTEMHEGFNRIERKLDSFIDVQSATNALTERRLRGLESREG
jgi:hypothetical protein